MIYCVEFGDVEAYLVQIGFSFAANVEDTFIFARGDELLTIPAPNINGHIPENLVLYHLDAADIKPPRFAVFWCD